VSGIEDDLDKIIEYAKKPIERWITPLPVVEKYVTENDLPKTTEIPDELSKMNRKQRREFYKQFRGPKEWRGKK